MISVVARLDPGPYGENEFGNTTQVRHQHQTATVTARRGYVSGGGDNVVILQVQSEHTGQAAEAVFTVEEFTEFVRMLGVL